MKYKSKKQQPALLFICLFFLIPISLVYGKVIFGNNQLEAYLPIIKNKKIGVVVNHTSFIKKNHLIDTLISLNINVKVIFTPEHGFRGDIEAGKKIENTIDKKTKLPILSLYGKNKKPKKSDFNKLDVIIFDIQDVGVRFYTYISTLHYVMQTCAETSTKLIILDRPNPNGDYIDGPVLDTHYKSFIGMHPIPIVHGLTIGELATMINGEQWLEGHLTAPLKIIKIKNYTHQTKVNITIPPSPNLKTNISIRLYPSLGLLEGTKISVGRGTDYPFQIYGHPKFTIGNYNFTPLPNKGAKNPKCKEKLCRGFFISNINKSSEINLEYLIKAYKGLKEKKDFFRFSFNNLAGNSELQEQIKKEWTEKEIKKSWEKDLENYKKLRKKYLLYP